MRGTEKAGRVFIIVSWLLAGSVQPPRAGEPAPELLPAHLRERLRGTPLARPLSDWERLREQPTGSKLRVVLEGARVLRGKLVSVSDEALTLRISRKLRTEPRAQVVGIHRRHHDPRSNGLLIGLGVGAAIGAIADRARVEFELIYEKAMQEPAQHNSARSQP